MADGAATYLHILILALFLVGFFEANNRWVLRGEAARCQAVRCWRQWHAWAWASTVLLLLLPPPTLAPYSMSVPTCPAPSAETNSNTETNPPPRLTPNPRYLMAQGRTVAVTLSMALGVCFCPLFNYLFIHPFGWGFTGAAWAVGATQVRAARSAAQHAARRRHAAVRGPGRRLPWRAAGGGRPPHSPSRPPARHSCCRVPSCASWPSTPSACTGSRRGLRTPSAPGAAGAARRSACRGGART